VYATGVMIHYTLKSNSRIRSPQSIECATTQRETLLLRHSGALEDCGGSVKAPKGH